MVDVLSDVWWAGAVVNISVKARVNDMRAEMGIDALTDALINMLPIGLVDVGIGMPVGLGGIVVVASVVIDLEFAVSVLYIVDVLVDALTTVYSDANLVTASCIGVKRSDVLKFVVPT